MTKHYIGTKAACEAVQTAADKLLGYPKTVTDGLVQDKEPEQLAADALLLTGQDEFVERFVAEVQMPTYAKVRKHPAKDEHAYPIDEKLDKASTASLGSTDKAALDDAKAAAAELPQDWQAAEPEPAQI